MILCGSDSLTLRHIETVKQVPFRTVWQKKAKVSSKVKSNLFTSVSSKFNMIWLRSTQHILSQQFWDPGWFTESETLNKCSYLDDLRASFVVAQSLCLSTYFLKLGSRSGKDNLLFLTLFYIPSTRLKCLFTNRNLMLSKRPAKDEIFFIVTLFILEPLSSNWHGHITRTGLSWGTLKKKTGKKIKSAYE